jgi:hypothetical protein
MPDAHAAYSVELVRGRDAVARLQAHLHEGHARLADRLKEVATGPVAAAARVVVVEDQERGVGVLVGALLQQFADAVDAEVELLPHVAEQVGVVDAVGLRDQGRRGGRRGGPRQGRRPWFGWDVLGVRVSRVVRGCRRVR